MSYPLKFRLNKLKHLPLILVISVSFILKCYCSHCPLAATIRCNCKVDYQLIVKNRSNSTVSAIFEDHYSDHSDSVKINPSKFDLQPNSDTVVSFLYTFDGVDVCFMYRHDNIKYREYVLLKTRIQGPDSSKNQKEFEIYPWDWNKKTSITFCKNGCTCYEEPDTCGYSYKDSVDVK